MRLTLRLLIAALLLGLPTAPAFAATTVEQLVALQRAGLDDDILVALIETDGSVFSLDANDILDLSRQGLSSKVIRAMQKTSVKTAAQAPELADAPPALPPASPLSAERHEAIRTEAPGVVNVYQTVSQQVQVPQQAAPAQIIALPVAVPIFVRPERHRPEPPVYWGWNGQRRPDSWDDGAARPTK